MTVRPGSRTAAWAIAWRGERRLRAPVVRGFSCIDARQFDICRIYADDGLGAFRWERGRTLDRITSMASAFGIVGAGAIGTGFKVRSEMRRNDQVGTIVLVSFLTVQALTPFCIAAPRRPHRGAQP